MRALVAAVPWLQAGLLAVIIASASPARAWPLSDGGHHALVEARRLTGQADAALATGDLDGAALAVGKVRVILTDSHTALDEVDRASLGSHEQEVGSRILAARSLARALAAREDARAALSAARAATRRTVAGFDQALTASAACTAAATPAGADPSWPIPPSGTRLADVALACAELTTMAQTDRETALADARFRANAIRALLRGDRIAIFAEHGEPADLGTPVEIAHAKSWRFVEGPTGPLRTFETWTFQFRGDALVSSRRVTTHDSP